MSKNRFYIRKNTRIGIGACASVLGPERFAPSVSWDSPEGLKCKVRLPESFICCYANFTSRLAPSVPTYWDSPLHLIYFLEIIIPKVSSQIFNIKNPAFKCRVIKTKNVGFIRFEGGPILQSYGVVPGS